MPTNILERPELEGVRFCFEMACQASRNHRDRAVSALRQYGDHGANVSGCVREHFPEPVKAELRVLAHSVTHYSDLGWKGRPRGVKHATILKLARAVAARDGSGFYGPQA